MFFIPLLTLLFIFWLFYIITNSSNQHYQDRDYNSNNNGYSLDRSLEILRERYARGEITTEEFQKIKKNLES